METIESVTQWAESTFGPASLAAMIEKAEDEMRELREVYEDSTKCQPAHLAEEAADVCICLFRLIGLTDPQALERKMGINRARKWNLKGDGTAQHV